MPRPQFMLNLWKFSALIELRSEKQFCSPQMQLRLISFALFELNMCNRIVQRFMVLLRSLLLPFLSLKRCLKLLAFYFYPFLHIAQQLKLIYAVETEAPVTVKCTSPAVIYLTRRQRESSADSTRLSLSPCLPFSLSLVLPFSHIRELGREFISNFCGCQRFLSSR